MSEAFRFLNLGPVAVKVSAVWVFKMVSLAVLKSDRFNEGLYKEM